MVIAIYSIFISSLLYQQYHKRDVSSIIKCVSDFWSLWTKGYERTLVFFMARDSVLRVIMIIDNRYECLHPCYLEKREPSMS